MTIVTPPAAAFVVRLPPDERACFSCGVPVPEHASTERFELTVLGRQGDPPLRSPREGTVTFSRCPACLERARAAEALAAAHPRLTARVGNVLGPRLTAALEGLAVLGAPLPAPTASEREVVALLRHLVEPGAAARWAARYAPVMLREARFDECTPRPWSHLTEGQRGALRASHAAMLAERVARTAPARLLAPPPLDDDDDLGGASPVRDGCVMCGVSHVAVPAAAVIRAGGPVNAARDVWTPARPSLTGLGAHGPGFVAGFTCPQCSAAVEHAGRAFGPTALDRAVLVHLDPGRADTLSQGSVQLDGVRGWAALAPRPAPSLRPWAHLGDLSRLVAAIGGLR